MHTKVRVRVRAAEKVSLAFLVALIDPVDDRWVVKVAFGCFWGTPAFANEHRISQQHYQIIFDVLNLEGHLPVWPPRRGIRIYTVLISALQTMYELSDIALDESLKDHLLHPSQALARFPNVSFKRSVCGR